MVADNRTISNVYAACKSARDFALWSERAHDAATEYQYAMESGIESDIQESAATLLHVTKWLAINAQHVADSALKAKNTANRELTK